MDTRCEYEEISDQHPELILLSKSPPTWRGFLIISHLSYDECNIHCPRVKLNLVVPNYPLLCDARINFGRQITALRSRKFSQNVRKLMTSPLKVSSFLMQLQLLIGKQMHNMGNKIHTIDLSINDLLQDVKEALQSSSDVQISCYGSLNTIKLSLSGASIVLLRNNNAEIPWKIIASDLPKIPALGSFEQNITNLSVAITKFKWQVELLKKAWEQLKEIDENFWVIDPLEPNKSHMYRRIHLSQSISVTITIDPLNPIALPLIKFSGSDNEVKKQTDLVCNNIINWDQNCSILENLRMLLNMSEFPKQQDSMENNAIVGNQECGICLFEKSDIDELPNKICDNKRCMKSYHSICLSKWLQMNTKNKVVFNRIYGICPHCKEQISCSIEY